MRMDGNFAILQKWDCKIFFPFWPRNGLCSLNPQTVKKNPIKPFKYAPATFKKPNKSRIGAF